MIRHRVGGVGAAAGVVAVALLGPGLSGCFAGVDPDQARLCRIVLPALHAPGSRIEVLETVPHNAPRTIAITYKVQITPSRIVERRLFCRFAAADRLRLEGLATPAGPVSDPTFYFLSRFYLGTPEAERADPGPPGGERTR